MVNIDAASQLQVTFRPPAPGSCLTPELLAELANLISVTLPTEALDSQGAPCVSSDSNNLAALDADNCILVPAATIYREEQTWDAASPSTNVVFDAFTASGFDALTCGLSIHIYLDSAETGIEVNKTAGGTAFIRPNFEIVERSAGTIEIAIKNALSDVRVEIELLKLPIPPEQV